MIIVPHETITTIHCTSSQLPNLLTSVIGLPICTSIARNRRSVCMFSAVGIFRIYEVVAHSKVMTHLMDKGLSSLNYTSTWASCQTRPVIPLIVTNTSKVTHTTVTTTLTIVAYPCVNVNIILIQTLNYSPSLSKSVVSYIQDLVSVNRGLCVLQNDLVFKRAM